MDGKSLSTRSDLEVKQEDMVDSSTMTIVEEEAVAEIAQTGIEGNVFDENNSTLNSSPNPKDTSKQADQLVSTKLEMDEVKEENDRLKKLLDQIMKDYQSLQMHLFDIVQQEQQAPKKSTNTTPTDEVAEESELVSLRLGRSPSSEHKSEDKNNSTKSKDEEDLQGLALGLDCKFGVTKSRQIDQHGLNPSLENSTDEAKKADSDEKWQHSKILKTMKSQEDEPSQQPQVKKTRVSVRARCNAPTMNDGCQWRKYGQKTAKGNPCPRAYYRCTVAPACPVRKQVQRSVEDMSILITTYEGTHNHPLPISASAMASTTTAAASMLTSGSSTSQSPLGTTNTATTSEIQRLLNFTLPHNSARASHYTLPNSSFISSSPSHPTITLDLTAPSSSSLNFPTPPKYSPPTPSFNFSTLESNSIPTSWSNNVYSANYGSQPYNKSPMGSSYLAKQALSQYTSYMQKNNNAINHESIEAATKAITSDPIFRSALTAAISSIVGNGGGMGAHGNQAGRHNNIQNGVKWSEPLLGLNRSSSSSSPPRETMGFLQPSMPFSSTASEVESRDKMN